jgi:hypothetical protein
MRNSGANPDGFVFVGKTCIRFVNPMIGSMTWIASTGRRRSGAFSNPKKSGNCRMQILF